MYLRRTALVADIRPRSTPSCANTWKREKSARSSRQPSAVLPRHSLGNRAQDLIRNGMRKLRMLARVHAEAVVGAEEYDLIRHPDARDACHVGQSPIHGDSPHN